jgi:hypothetical protein
MRMLVTGFAYRPKGVWWPRAACADADPKVFAYADMDDDLSQDGVVRVNRVRHAVARTYCERCPVVAQCLGEALMSDAVGTHGGELLTPRDWKVGRPIRRGLGL